MTVGSKVKQTLAGLKGIESTLRIYSVQSKNKEEIKVYKEALKTTESVIKSIENRIKRLEFEEPQYKGN
ncbi:hypothetical protein CPAST_c12060 [Clostridium pasteurianum DSM 525 = ATCC 6013]|uniref:DUF1657 domain-containing protein n=1 Tax=Clostridium pasteurianum DSM 525 = ATCC 6013 TaxID=1262449 RepID=A0A0H3J0E0_CLOPA|nr:DUF1657 domain-containing protein [Clostridium pasteurianum]AJA47306.1 hypothetical protein CPAST_c12060 [Clostridium pasteurianum DSM 525 = ATCC 6013]AJA51294.1 hypothetical protein CLPA_c12060 [Clostridium pasteurianum DSM 525 = ATCC 6013]AOZ74646.1 hypothetical protein AQ983_05825 [Clostridium pasteurianum DSM 525 = ATCC 6013]AOZ78443.1 hypothetical protein AQ984_05815 [Clostridium pasteurianum]ELP58643.1 hypothetical protein F502_12708 [Clostridium pasteurianum DSM 525 = ATCC 6013]